MAKVKAPLFGLGARGQLGKALVYFPWKGIDAVREYVIPTNPKTALQTSQRNKLKAAVTEFHTASYTAEDVSAWTRYASTLAKVMTGFNAMCREHIAAFIADPTATWNSLSDIGITDVSGTAFTVVPATAESTDTLKLFYGISKTFMPTEISDTGTPPDVSFELTGLTEGQDYYFYIKASAATMVARTGVYKHRAAAP